MKRIDTAVIPVGGYGTRFLPATKSVPKEMFPLINKPVVLHVVEEVVKSGIKNIVLVVSHHKQSVESFFSPNEMLEEYYQHLGKDEKVEELRKISGMAEFSYVYTQPPYGNGGALKPVKHMVGDNPFVVVWADELIVTRGKPRVQQCIEAFNKVRKPVISAIEIKDPKQRHRYGMAELKNLPGKKWLKQITRIAEKPAPGDEPSAYAAHGCYVLVPEVFDILAQSRPGKDGELWLTDLVNGLMERMPVYAQIIQDGVYLDCGNPLDYLYSQIEYALGYSQYAAEVKQHIKKILSRY